MGYSGPGARAKLIYEKKLAENFVFDFSLTQTEDAGDKKRARIERGGRRECGGRERRKEGLRKREKEGRVEEESTMRKEGEEGQSTNSEAKF
jgi:hypothetical protein